MKTSTLTNTFTAAIATVIAMGITALPAMGATDAAAATQTSSTARLTSDKPEVRILFHHTAAAPYDIRTLSWCGGMAVRVQVVPTTTKPFVVAYNTGDLLGAKITGRDPSRIGFVICKAGKTKVLFDMLCLEKRQTLLPNLATRLSDKNEWRMDLALQEHGQLNTKNFARTPISRDLRDPSDRYAFSSSPIATN